MSDRLNFSYKVACKRTTVKGPIYEPIYEMKFLPAILESIDHERVSLRTRVSI